MDRLEETRFSWFVFGLMASVTFVGILSEMVPSGILPQMTEGLGVSESQVGFLVGIYALASAICAIPLVSATLAMNRKTLLLVLLIGFAVSNLVDAVFGMHNMPGLELGKLYFADGDVMAAVDNWEIELTGKGGHGSMPELSIDPVVAGASLVMALQTIVSRNVSPHNSGVVTVGAFQAGNAGNVIAQSAILRLSIRTTTPADRELVLGKVKTLARTQAEGYGCTCAIREGVPGAVLVNDKDETRRAAEIARVAFGEEKVVYPGPTFLGSEDFAFMLQQQKGTYCFIGNGDTPMVHHPQFVLDQSILPKGAAYWVALTEGYLR